MDLTRTIISCVGDDLTEALTDDTGLGWVSRVQERLPKIPSMYNLAVSGESSNQIYSRVATEVMLHNAEDTADYIIISSGTIDCAVKEIYGESMQSVWEGKMLRFLNKLVKLGTIPIILTLPLYDLPGPCVEFGTRIKKIKWYNNFLKEFCKENSFKVIDLENLWKEGESAPYLADSFHLNTKGYELLSDKLLEELSQFLTLKLEFFNNKN